MVERWTDDEYTVIREKMLPIAIKASDNIDDVLQLMKKKSTCISFDMRNCAVFRQKGAYVVLDFGKELCGGIRFVTRAVFDGTAVFRVTLGESLSECCSDIGTKNATNDHSPRDFEVKISNMSDLTYGQSGFRFARIEMLSDNAVLMKNIFAVSTLPYFEKEGYIKTDDALLNEIIDTAFYTLKLNFQNGHIWDGIKRDRLVWSGDLHQEIISSVYLFGDNRNVVNSLSFLREEAPTDGWLNGIPSYSAWWVINLCDYCIMTGNTAFFRNNEDFARSILSSINRCIKEDGTMDFEMPEDSQRYFLDWPTMHTEDAPIGTACILMIAAQRYLKMQEDVCCRDILRKLNAYIYMPCKYKQTRAFQILAGRCEKEDAAFLEAGCAKGLSTFMAYYILKADAAAGGTNMLSAIKQYFGGMLSRGATTFWEDFDIEWLEGSGRIDQFPAPGQKDIHGDYGAYCYEGFRHSLCHGWASGVLSFIIECMLGITMRDGQIIQCPIPNSIGLKDIEAKLPVKNGWYFIKITNGSIVRAGHTTK